MSIRSYLQDRLNAQHMYCRLIGCGVSVRWSRRIAGAWEWMTKKVLYGA